MLYRDIVECVDQIEFEVIDNPNIPEALSIIDINDRFTSYQNNPPSLPLDDGLDLPLDKANLLRLRQYIIEKEKVSLAIDIIDPYPEIATVIDYITKAMAAVKATPTCIDYLIFLQSVIADIRVWANSRFQQIGSNLETALRSQRDSAYLIMTEYFQEHERNPYLAENKTTYQPTNKLSHLFVKNLDLAIVSGIYQTITEINNEKSEGYITLIAAIIAEAYDRKYLRGNYNYTLKAIFNHLYINEDSTNYRPARFRKANMKGTIPESHLKALNIINKLSQVEE